MVMNESSVARIVEAIGADAHEGERYFPLRPGVGAIVDTTGGSNTPVDQIVIYDVSCRAIETIADNFTKGATITLVDGDRASRSMGRNRPVVDNRSPDWDYGETSCEAAVTQL